MEESEATPLLL